MRPPECVASDVVVAHREGRIADSIALIEADRAEVWRAACEACHAAAAAHVRSSEGDTPHAEGRRFAAAALAIWCSRLAAQGPPKGGDDAK